MLLEDMFKQANAETLKSPVVLRGSDSYLQSELKNMFKSKDYEWQELKVSKSGLRDVDLDPLMQIGLFATSQRVLWVMLEGPRTGWSKEALGHWQRLLEYSEQGNLVFVQVPADKRMKWEDLGPVVDFEVTPEKKPLWIRRAAKRRNFNLGPQHLEFLMTLDLEMSSTENALELWALGGDEWASQTLGWGDSTSGSLSKVHGNPVYAWVDAALLADRRQYVALTTKLLEQGQEPFMMMALLAKSVRLLASLEAAQSDQSGGVMPKEPAFLVRKLQPLAEKNLRSKRLYQGRTWGQYVLGRLSDLDVKAKSSSINLQASLQNLLG